LIDLRQREPHMDEHPLARSRRVAGQQADADHPPDPADVHPGQVWLAGQEPDPLTGYAQAHRAAPFMTCQCPPLTRGRASCSRLLPSAPPGPAAATRPSTTRTAPPAAAATGPDKPVPSAAPAGSQTADPPISIRPATGSPVPAEYCQRKLPQRRAHRGVAGQAQRRQRPAVPARVQEQGRKLLPVGGAAAAAEGQQAPARGEPGGHVTRARHQPRAVAGEYHLAQLQDLARLRHRGLASLLEHGSHICAARIQERIERLRRSGGSGRGLAALTRHPRRCHGATTAMASLACTRIASPIPALTSATLTSSSREEVSTTARSSSSSRTIVTTTAVSEQVMQISS